MPRLNENELQRMGFSLGTIEWFRAIDTIASPGTISLDVTEMESLMHEFRLLRNELDVLRRAATENEIQIPFTHRESADELFIERTPADIKEKFLLSSTGTNYTTSTNEIVVCTAAITVTLNPSPTHEEEVIVKRNTTAGTVTVSSASINIDGALTYDLVTNYEAVRIIYSQYDNEWFLV